MPITAFKRKCFACGREHYGGKWDLCGKCTNSDKFHSFNPADPQRYRDCDGHVKTSYPGDPDYRDKFYYRK